MKIEKNKGGGPGDQVEEKIEILLKQKFLADKVAGEKQIGRLKNLATFYIHLQGFLIWLKNKKDISI